MAQKVAEVEEVEVERLTADGEMASTKRKKVRKARKELRVNVYRVNGELVARGQNGRDVRTSYGQ